MDNEIFTQLLLGLIAFAFTGWAAVVAWGVRAVIARIDVITSSVRELDKDLNQWVNTTEGRLAHLEEWRRILEGIHDRK